METFSKKTTEFLWGLALNNEKPWFLEHKNEYEEHLKKPFRALAEKVAAEMEERFPEERLRLHISRIYRDARRLHGQGPFKEHIWFSLKNSDGLLEGPMFWFEIGARDYSCGMGCYDAPAQIMEEHRRLIDLNPRPLADLVEKFGKQTRFVLDGEDYKRPKGNPGELLFGWYNKRYVSLTHSGTPGKELYSPNLGERLVEDFTWLMPYYKYLAAIYRREV